MTQCDLDHGKRENEEAKSIVSQGDKVRNRWIEEAIRMCCSKT